MEEKSTTASRSIAVALIVLVLVALSVAMPSSWFGSKAKSENQKLTIDVSRIKSKKAIATDENTDGMVTWKEVMEQTLPMTEEQKEELKNLPVDQRAIDALNDESNLTASFSKNLYLMAASIQENNITNEDTKRALMEKISQEEANKIQPKSYTDKDVIIAKAETKASIKAYGNAIFPLLDGIITKESITGNMTGVLTYLESNNTSGLPYLYKDKKRLDTLLKKLSLTEVPPSAILIHIQMLNRISVYKEVVDNLSRVESDPIRTSLVLEQYIPAGRAVVEMFTKYTDYFNRQNVTFTSREAGYVFITGYTLH